MPSLVIVADDKELKEVELWKKRTTTTTMANTRDSDTGRPGV